MAAFPAPNLAELPPSARRLLDAQQDVVLSRQLTRNGIGADEVRRLVAQGALHRLRRGVLVDGAAWELTAPWERHAVRARAVGLEVRLGEKCLHRRPARLAGERGHGPRCRRRGAHHDDGLRSPRRPGGVRLPPGRRESAGESRTAWLCAELPMPELIPQAVITDELGEFVARVDFLVRGHRVVVEFDGLLKYDGRQQLVNEKRREDQLRRLGYEVVRLTWEDLDDPGKVLRMIRSAIERASARVA